MNELAEYIPGIVKLFIVIGVIVLIAAGFQWLIDNPAVLVIVLAAVGGLIYLWRKRVRARTMV